MFDKLKAMGAVAALLKDKDKLRDAGERIKAKMEAIRATGEAGGGACRVTVNGKLRVLTIEMQPAMVSTPAALGAAGALIAEATNEALARAQTKVHDEVSREARAMGLPEIPEEVRNLLQ